MSRTLELKNSNNKSIQINCQRDFIFDDILYKIIAGEDGSIKVGELYLPYAIDTQGWLIQIEDVYMTSEDSIFIVSSDGIIAHYKKEKYLWNYKILFESGECYYNIKEATLVATLLSLYVDTEFSGLVHLSYDLNQLM